MREAHAFLREPIEVRSLVRGATVAGEALDPEVIAAAQETVARRRSERESASGVVMDVLSEA